MADLTLQERLQPSLLDRLTDDDPGNPKESADKRVLSLTQLKASVLRDLAWLFNTIAPLDSDTSGEIQAGSSVVNYGLPPLAGHTASSVDVQAIEASRDNAQRNGIADEKLALHLPEHMPAMQADVLVANILAGPLVSLAPQLSGLVRPGGLLALSGILAEQGEDVAAAYAADFELDPIVVRDGWVRISGRRR